MGSISQKPTFVLVHGAWHQPAHGAKLVKALEGHGYNTVAVALPSSVEEGASIPEDMQTDVDEVRKSILKVLDRSDVIVVTHSYGGLPGSAAIEGLDTATRKKEGHNTSVVALAGISTFLQPVGMTVGDGREENPPGCTDFSAKATLPTGDAKYWFYHDCEQEEAEKYVRLLRPMSMSVLISKSTFAAFEVVPTHYLLCSDDKIFPYEGQKMVVQRIRDAGFKVREETVHTSHSPFLSQPERTADFLRRTAGEDIPE